MVKFFFPPSKRGMRGGFLFCEAREGVQVFQELQEGGSSFFFGGGGWERRSKFFMKKGAVKL